MKAICHYDLIFRQKNLKPQAIYIVGSSDVEAVQFRFRFQENLKNASASMLPGAFQILSKKWNITG